MPNKAITNFGQPVSHYWDCRMKGRPPGTPKSDDPAKKKRKRFARERDLCDVKIKITEHFPDATFAADGSINICSPSGGPLVHQFPDGVMLRVGGQGVANNKYWTIQRVNGNGGNGKGDGVPGPHKHTLEKSDEIKKSTVQRFLAAQEKEARKGQVSLNNIAFLSIYTLLIDMIEWTLALVGRVRCNLS